MVFDTRVRYATCDVNGLEIFYREAGPADAPTLLLLHGLPSSSRMFGPLFDRLASKFRLIAPDYPGFGHSTAPTVNDFDYSFKNIARVMSSFLGEMGVESCSVYMQDYGGPVGFNMAIDEHFNFKSLILQNAVLHDSALGESWNPRRAFWADRAANEEAIQNSLLSPEKTRERHVGSDPDTSLYDPDLWTDELCFLKRPNEAEIQSQLVFDYQNNVASYPRWQAWLRKSGLPLLVLWGRYDQSFELSEPASIQQDVPSAQVHLLDAGHFALDTVADRVAMLVTEFLEQTT